MSKSKAILAVAVLAFGTPVIAGVEMSLVSRNAAGATTDTTTVIAQAGKIRMDDQGSAANERLSMIFRDREFVVVNHADRSYMVLDEAMIEKMGAQVNSAMKQMEAQLAGMPPEQRAMVEQMMQGQMQGMMGDAAPPAPPRVEKTGSGNWQSETCTRYAVYEKGEKTQEICAARLDDVEGADEMMQSFRAMAGFLQKMSEAMPGPLAASMADNPMGLMDQIQGFPVRTAQFANGQLDSETTLESVVDRQVDDALFAAPANYTRADPFAGR